MLRLRLSVLTATVMGMTSEPVRNRLIVLDTETTGLNAWRHQPWEVAWCDVTSAVTGDAPLDSLPVYTLLLPHSVEDANPISLEIGRYADRCTGEEASVEDVFDLWAALGGMVADNKRKPILVGSNPAFDAGMLGGLFHRHGLPSSPWYQRSTDVSDMARFGLGWVSDEGLPLGLGPLSERLGVVNHGAHTAAGDVRATSEVFLRLVEMLAGRGLALFPAAVPQPH